MFPEFARLRKRRNAGTGATGVDGNRTHQSLLVQQLNGFEGRGTHQASGHSPKRIDISLSGGIESGRFCRLAAIPFAGPAD